MTIAEDTVRCDREVYFFDCGEVSRTISKIYGGLLPISGFIANGEENVGETLNGRKVYPLADVIRKPNSYLVIATNRGVGEISARLKKLGLSPQKDFCHYKEWIRCYFEAVLRDEKRLLQDYVELYITDRCTLRCKSCILFAPYVSKPRDRNLDAIQRDIELYFKYVDKVSVFRLMGGEPFIHNQFDKILTAISGGGYRKQIEQLIVVSNGTVIPAPKILQMLAEMDIAVHVSDYPTPLAQKQRAKLIEAFQAAGVKYFIKPMRWVDVHGDPKVSKQNSIPAMMKLFRECSVRCRTIYDGKLYFCAIDAAAQRAGFINGADDDFVSLVREDDILKVKSEILALDAGKIGKGYSSFCRNCYGGTDSNNRIIPVAEQL